MQKTQDDTHTDTEPSDARLEHKSGKRNYSRLLVVLILLVALLWFMLERGGSNSTSGSIDSVDLDNIQTYLSKSSSDPEKKTQSEFVQGDPIQVGFTYENTSVEEDTLVKFVVKHEQSREEAFATNFFMLDPQKTELFVSINNTNLAPGQYTVELQDAEGAFNASVDYEITE